MCVMAALQLCGVLRCMGVCNGCFAALWGLQGCRFGAMVPKVVPGDAWMVPNINIVVPQTSAFGSKLANYFNSWTQQGRLATFPVGGGDFHSSIN